MRKLIFTYLGFLFCTSLVITSGCSGVSSSDSGLETQDKLASVDEAKSPAPDLPNGGADDGSGQQGDDDVEPTARPEESEATPPPEPTPLPSPEPSLTPESTLEPTLDPEVFATPTPVDEGEAQPEDIPATPVPCGTPCVDCPEDDSPTPCSEGDGESDTDEPTPAPEDTPDDIDSMDVDQDGFSPAEGDCDDLDRSVHPEAEEVCDERDNDCDSLVDEGLEQLLYLDEDLDGFGQDGETIVACGEVEGYSTEPGDCDDRMWSVNPDGYELCNEVDDDCDGLVDGEDTFDVEKGGIYSFNSRCSEFEEVGVVEMSELKFSYNILAQYHSYTIEDGVFVGGSHSDAVRPSDWPSDCTFFDEGYYWYDIGNVAGYYPMKVCFSRATDAEGGDEVYIQISYEGLTMDGVFNTEEDADAEIYDELFLSEAESSGSDEVWYISDSLSVQGSGYSATVGISGARAVLTLER